MSDGLNGAMAVPKRGHRYGGSKNCAGHYIGLAFTRRCDLDENKRPQSSSEPQAMLGLAKRKRPWRSMHRTRQIYTKKKPLFNIKANIGGVEQWYNPVRCRILLKLSQRLNWVANFFCFYFFFLFCFFFAKPEIMALQSHRIMTNERLDKR